jgi:hypothetical protein
MLKRDNEYAGLDPGFAAQCKAADAKQRRQPRDPRLARLLRLMADDISLERAWQELNAADHHGRAAASTVEALMFSLRSGVQALGRSDTIHRLAELSDEQLRDVAVRLQKFKPHVAPAWNAEDVAVLIAVRRKALENS